MEWHRYSGFVGEGIYVIINKASMTSLDMNEGASEPGAKVQGFAHSPNNGAQVWRFIRHHMADLYVIRNMRGELVLAATGNLSDDHPYRRLRRLTSSTGTDEELVGQKHPRNMSGPAEALWVVDSSMYSLHPGKMVM
ncbi:MAG: hypothetical protein Q9207_007009 [Kuettlingeria erythrocarpa]